MSDLSRLRDRLSDWPIPADMLPNFVYTANIQSRTAVTTEFPKSIDAKIQQILIENGIEQLYSHQLTAWQNAQDSIDQVIVSGTASGKSLCYQLPIFQSIVMDADSRALCVFPTKSLTSDQLKSLNRYSDSYKSLTGSITGFSPGIYDGDTPTQNRKTIRENVRILLTNPDMLHAGILPRHTQWSHFFKSLKYVVIDEIHAYRGVFGSHVANVFRRLQRLLDFYESHPVWIMTSATIGNPVEHAAALATREVVAVADDGSAHSGRIFSIYNPPLSDPELGIRKSSLFEMVSIVTPLLKSDIQTIIFGRARKTVELALSYLRQISPELTPQTSAYRAGYLPAERRKIEGGLRNRQLLGVFTTNALELGVDIGSMDASVLIGYPGTIASTTQQIGRAGRQNRIALSVLIATAAPIDQYLASHPHYFTGLSPEAAIINPDHLAILLEHIKCAAFELPFHIQPFFGNMKADEIYQFLQILEMQGYLYRSDGNYFWANPTNPAFDFSLRTATNDQVEIVLAEEGERKLLGTVDKLSSYWMVHPGAIYFHDGATYLVKDLDLEKNVAEIAPSNDVYFTEPSRNTTIEIIKPHLEVENPTSIMGFGELMVHSQVTGFKKVKFFSHENLGMEELDMPVVDFPTVGTWLCLKPQTVDDLRDQGLWLNDRNDYGPNWNNTRELVLHRDQYRCRVCGTPQKDSPHHVHHKIPFKSFTSIVEANRLDNLITLCSSCHRIAEVNLHVQSGLAGLAYSLRNLAPLFLMCDSGDLEVVSEPMSPAHSGTPSITIYDDIPGGIGLSRVAYDRMEEIIFAVKELIEHCPCSDGCPSCIGPAGENGFGGKQETIAICEQLIKGLAHG